MKGVKSYQGRVELEWVINSTLSLTLNAHGRMSLTEDGWAGSIVPETDDDRTCLYWGNPYLVRLGGEHCFDAGVGEPGEDGAFPVWEWETRPEPCPPCPDCQTPMRWSGTYTSGPELNSDFNILECPACSTRHMRANTAEPWTAV